MPIEKLLVRSLIVLALIFLILTLTYYPPGHAIPPLMFLLIFIGAEFALPNDSGKGKKRLSKIAEKVIVVVLSFAAMASIASLFVFWKVGHLWRLK